MTRAGPTHMDRQAFPSIVLSVSIVCFFAVALYERDKVPRGPAKDLAARKPGPAGDLAGQSTKSPVPGPQAAPDREGDANRASDPVRGLASRPVPSTGGRSEPTASAGRPGGIPGPVIRRASERTGEAAPSPTPSRGHPRESEGKLARSPFTVVGAGETIADVARRVYGTPENAGALWRANRDVLQGLDSPVAPGTVLRTPAAPLR